MIRDSADGQPSPDEIVKGPYQSPRIWPSTGAKDGWGAVAGPSSGRAEKSRVVVVLLATVIGASGCNDVQSSPRQEPVFMPPATSMQRGGDLVPPEPTPDAAPAESQFGPLPTTPRPSENATSEVDSPAGP